MWLERASTGLRSGVDLGSVPGPTWVHVLAWSNYHFWVVPYFPDGFPWYGGYLGLSLVALGLTGMWAAVQRRHPGLRRPAAAAASGLAVAVYLVIGYRYPPLHGMAIVQSLNAARYLLFVCFFLALAAAWGVRLLHARHRSHRAQVAAWVLVVLCLDLGPTTFQNPYRRTPEQEAVGLDLGMDEARRFGSRGELPNYRALWIRGDSFEYLATSTVPLTCAVPVVHGVYNGDRLAVPEFVGVLDDPVLVAAARLLNVRHVVVSVPTTASTWAATFSLYTPILVCSRLEPFRDAELVDPAPSPARRALARDAHGGVALRAPLRAHLRPGPAGPQGRGHRVYDQRCEIEVRLSDDCFARLAYAYSPHLRVTVDGAVVQAIETADHFVAVRRGGDRTASSSARACHRCAGCSWSWMS